MRKFHSVIFLGIVLLGIYACGGVRKETQQEKKGEVSASHKYLMEIRNLQDTFTTIELTGSIKVDFPDFNGSGQAIIRMYKDSIIWVSVRKFGFEIARIYLSPDSSIMLNRIQGKCYKASTESFLKEFTGFPLDFSFIQAGLLGNVPITYTVIPPIDFRNDTLNLHARSSDIIGRMTLQFIYPHKNPSYVTAINNYGQKFIIENKEFKTYDKVYAFPLKRKYYYRYGSGAYEVLMTLSTVSVNKDLSFPMRIPAHYEILYH